MAIHQAARKGYLENVQAILNHSPDLITAKGGQSEGKTPIIYAVESTNTDLIKYLLQRTQNVNFTTNKGNTALHYAAVLFDDESLDINTVHDNWRLLLKHGAECFSIPNTRKYQTPLEKLPFYRPLWEMLNKAWESKLDLAVLSDSQLIKLILNPAHIDDWLDEMMERPEYWSKDHLAFREFKFLYPPFCEVKKRRAQ